MAGSRRFTKNEIMKMIEQSPPREKVFVLLGAYMGTRMAEALALKIGDVRGKEYVTIRSLKGGMIQQYPTPPRLKQAVEDLCEWYKSRGIEFTDESPLFISFTWRWKKPPLPETLNHPMFKAATPLSRRGMVKLFRTLLDDLKIKGNVSAHGLRKSFITSIYRITGNDIVRTRVYSRHKSLTNLQYYIDAGTDTGLIKALTWDESDSPTEEKEDLCMSM